MGLEQLVSQKEEAWSEAAEGPGPDTVAAVHPAAASCVHVVSGDEVLDFHVAVEGSLDLEIAVHCLPRGLAASSIDRCRTGPLPFAWGIGPIA